MAKAALKSTAAVPTSAVRTSARGVAQLDLGDRKIGLKLTLAAMDQIENEFDLESIADLEEKLAKPSAKHLAKLLAILARAAGEEITETAILQSSVEIPDLVEAIMAALAPNRGADEKNVDAPSV